MRLTLHLIFLMFISAPIFTYAQQGGVFNYLKLLPTTIPATCSVGDLRTNTSTGVLNQCSASNTWTTYLSSLPMTTLGDTLYENSTPAPARLAGNTTTTKKFLTQTGTGTVSAAPSWGVLASGDIPNNAANTSGTAGGLSSTLAISSGGTGLTSTSQNFAFIGPTSGSGAPTWRALVAGDIPTLNQNTTGTAANITGTSNSTLTTISTLTSVGTIATGTWAGTTVATNHGGTGVTSVTTTPTASSWAGWDSNVNMNANNFVPLSQSIATAAGTTTLTITSPMYTTFTGSTTQTLKLPVVSTLALGTGYYVSNNSTGVVTVQSSGANTIQAMAAGTVAYFASNATTGTSASVWNYLYSGGTPTFSGLTQYGSAYATTTTALGTTSAGTTGQVLTATTSAAPAFANPATASYWQGYHAETMYWTLGTASTQSDFTSSGATPAITQLSGSGITVTQASGSLPGITFTPASSTAVYEITATFACDPQTPGLTMGVFLVGGSNNISGVSTNISSGGAAPMTVSGIFAPASGSAQTVKLQGYSTSTGGNLGFLPGSGFPGAIYWTVVRLF